jgi:hypothetical protein
VGESVLQIAPNAAAAYSLRSLTGGDPKVVRVRRASDNGERDFTSSDVTSGEMLRWVNAQAIKPLDIQALEADGRTGDFLIAKAAYSLRSLGTRQATLAATGDTVARANDKFVAQVRRNVNGDLKSFTATEVTDGTLTSFVNESFTSSLPLDVSGSASAAYGLRNLSSTYSGDVVEVRRSSDDTVQGFTAAEVADGTLVNWVNEDVTIYQSDFSVGVNGFDSTPTTTATGNQDGVSDSAGTSKNNVLKVVKAADAQAYIERDQGVVAGLTYTVSGSVFTPASNTTVDGIAVKDGISGGSLSNYPSGYLISAGTWADFSFSYTATVDGNQRFQLASSSLGSNPNGSSTGSTGDIVYIADLKFVETTSNGFVETWYDQSGNSNDAVQATPANQPKIVSAGSLVTRNGDAAIISTVDNSMTFTLDSLSADGQQSVFAVLENDITSQDMYPRVFDVSSNTANDAHGGDGANFRPRWTTTPNGSLFFQVDSFGGYSNTSRERHLYSHVMNDTAGGTSTVHQDGTQVDTRSITLDANTTFSTGNLLQVRTNATGALYMSEVIYYPSDQSTKRRAIEESLAGHYGITLGSFNRDGFVKTWYDQSVTNQAGDTATNNHAVQATAGNQPKIVNAGSLVAESGIDFDGSQFLQANSVSGMGATVSMNVASVHDSGGGGCVSLASSASGVTNFGIIEGGLVSNVNARNTTSVTASASVSGVTRLSFALTTGQTSTKSGALGGTLVESTSDYGDDFTSGELDRIIIGKLRASSGTLFNGRIREALIYDTDQSDNRTAIEANIGEAYSITGIPAYDNTVDGFVETWYDQSGNNRPLIQTTASEQPLIVEAGTFLNGVKSNQATSNSTMQNLQVSTDGTNADFGTDDWASGASLKLGAVYVGTVPAASVVTSTSKAIIWGGSRGVGSFQLGGVSLAVVKGGTDAWALRNERQGLSPSTMENVTSLNTDADVVLYGTTDNREFTINVNGSGDTDTESADLDVREGQALSLFGAYNGSGGSYYQRSSGGVCKECYLYAGDSVANIPALATSINAHYSIY